MVNIRTRTRIARAFTLNRAITSCIVAALGTAIAFAIIFLFPLVTADKEILAAYAKHSLPQPFFSMVIGIATALLVAFAFGIKKLWHSMRLGLIPLSAPLWIACVATSWIALEVHRPRLAASVMAAPALLSLAVLFLRKPRKGNDEKSSDASLDLPVPEGGEDLLGLGEAIAHSLQRLSSSDLELPR
jgi:membrane-associated phospholipid phosphatase